MNPSLRLQTALLVLLFAPVAGAEAEEATTAGSSPSPDPSASPTEPAPNPAASGSAPAPATSAPSTSTPAPATGEANSSSAEPSSAERPEGPHRARSMDSQSNTEELTLQDRSGDAARTRQRPTEVTLSYSTALALGATRDFVGDFSFVGFGLDWHRRFGERLSAGVSLGWQVLYDKTRDTTVIDSLAITGVQLRHLNAFPILLSARFLPQGPSRSVGPYVGLGVGAYPSERRADIGLVSLSSFSVHFGFAPEIGLQIPTRTLGRLCLGVKYNYAFKSAENPELSYFAFTVGVAR